MLVFHKFTTSAGMNVTQGCTIPKSFFEPELTYSNEKQAKSKNRETKTAEHTLNIQSKRGIYENK